MNIGLFLEGYDVFFVSTLYASSINWLSVAQKLNELDILAEQLGVTSLNSFINTTRDDVPLGDYELSEFEQVSELVGGHWYLDGQVLWSTSVQWFAPEQGLVTVRTLLSYLRSLQQEKEFTADNSQAWNENLKPDYLGVIYELEEMEKVLSQGVEESRLFRIFVVW